MSVEWALLVGGGVVGESAVLERPLSIAIGRRSSGCSPRFAGTYLLKHRGNARRWCAPTPDVATATVTTDTDTDTVKKLIATALFAGAFAAGTAMTAPEELTSRTSDLPAADTLYDLLQADPVEEDPAGPQM
ncbi:hypothetical protein F610DRAFT_00620 [Streptomyces sp. LaPpAH-199]|nr:hypothetical protein F610DRAFT_00620 [Streptomyces sp. LaPpAH-199]